jgi:hypothetical protein
MLQNKDDFIITGHEYVEYMHIYLSMGCLHGCQAMVG